ncbi:MAG: hypothetical protein LQ339_001277 [Xanthoria mediterranea]|nr:MAG: hypothetical protein LQ339_001277 [Xanthoria mediterranea]
MSLPGHYETPHFPALYWPIGVLPGEPQYLYTVQDAWRFTLFWTLIVFELCHLAASSYALLVQWRNWKVMLGVVPLYSVLAGVEALMAGSVVGLLLGAVYKAGDFRMSTWLPFIWAIINVLVLILSSFSVQGGL